MEALVVVLAVGVPVVIMVGYAWLATRARRRRVGSSFLAPFEDMWHPAAHRTDVVAEAKAVTPAPADPPRSGAR